MFGNLKRHENRWYPRIYDLDGSLPGVLKVAGDDSEVAGEVCDICIDGVGMIVTKFYEPSSEFLLTTSGGEIIRFRLVYCRRELMRKGFFRIGIQRIDGGENLIDVFAAAGLVRKQAKQWWS